MIPIKLTIEGLYSYKERQTIDFEKLTASGLFGILGSVGSGKSSILEAMSYVLYGETERLNKQDRRAYNMLNLSADRAFIEFDYENYEGKQFRAVRELRRNSKRYHEVQAVNTVFYEKKDRDWIPLELTDAEQIIGLSYANFKRTMIIPQGQFKEFLELGAKERTNMMKEIFQLQRFDLFYKVAELFSESKSTLDTMNGELLAYESYSAEALSELSIALGDAVAMQNKLQQELEAVTALFERQRQLKADFDALQVKQEALALLQEKLPQIEEQERLLNRYERIYRLFFQDAKMTDSLQLDLAQSKKIGKELTEKKVDIEHRMEQSNKELEMLRVYADQLPNKRREELDLGLLIQIAKSSQKIADTEKRCKKGRELVDGVVEEQHALKVRLTELEVQIGEEKKVLLPTELIVKIGDWFAEKRGLESSLSEKERDEKKALSELDVINKALKRMKIDVASFKDEIEQSLRDLDKEVARVNGRKNELSLQQELAGFSRNLQDGKACPLCGSKEHPAVLHVEDVGEEIVLVDQELRLLDLRREELQNHRIEGGDLLTRYQNELKVLSDIRTELSSRRENLKNHFTLFIWDGYDSNDEAGFEEKKKTTFEAAAKVETLLKEVDRLRLEIESADQKQDEYKKALQLLESEITAAEASIATNQSNLELLSIDDFMGLSADDITLRRDALAVENNRIEKRFNELISDIHQLEPKLASTGSLLENQQKEERILISKIESLEQQIAGNMLQEKLKDRNELQQILHEERNTEKERTEINNFKIEFGTLKNEVEALEKKMEGVAFDPEHFNQVFEQHKRAESKLEIQKKEVTTLDVGVKEMKQKLDEKKELVRKRDKQAARNENLNLLHNLFSGASFVQYVSTIYLAQLSNLANRRFHRMTRNQLSLQLNDRGDFEVVDYMNGGKSRSVKTLSGGQTFQAALSLALALAEGVQTNARSDKNFFFIDEGFGTQDKESVNIVFETLLNLHKENKIVGVISHVEELKERMPMALLVEKSEERGSIIRELY